MLPLSASLYCHPCSIFHSYFLQKLTLVRCLSHSDEPTWPESFIPKGVLWARLSLALVFPKLVDSTYFKVLEIMTFQVYSGEILYSGRNYVFHVYATMSKLITLDLLHVSLLAHPKVYLLPLRQNWVEATDTK